ncbi:MAG: anthranilate synthase component I family protein [Bacteroidales bacterium]|nr:anthranilate synthase component I family protein [Bacteroidales bacterium]
MWKINTEVKQINTKIYLENILTAVDKYNGVFLFTTEDFKGDNHKNIIGLNPIININNSTISYSNKKLSTNPLNTIDDIINLNKTDNLDFPLLIGYLSYDYKNEVEEKGLYKNLKTSVLPDLYFSIYEYYIIIPNNSDNIKIVQLHFPFSHKKININSVINEFKNETKIKIQNKTSSYTSSSLNKNEFISGVNKIKKYIKQGDIYQANLTREITGKTEYSPIEIAYKLYHSNSIEFGVFAKIENKYLISTSPEKFFKISNNKITTSPIKGTIFKSKKNIINKKNINELLNSKKELAELAMIVDLLRNDINKICTTNTVNVIKFPEVKELINVYHLYSDIEGQLSTKKFKDIVKALFPGGSISGCPKIRACQIIEELEKQGRGPYTGSYGYINFNQNMDFNILIRTLFYHNKNISFNVGGGITLLSNATDEYEETIFKAKNIYYAINMEQIYDETYCLKD